MLSAVLAAAAALGPVPATCPASVVRYDAQVPSVGVASLPTYTSSLWDRRVNQRDGLVLWRRGGSIVWNTPGRVVARRLGGRGSFTTEDSSLTFPSTGCWRLTVGDASIVARVVSVPKKRACGATVLEHGWALARPRSSGIKGGWPWQGFGPARLTTHGHDGDNKMKVPWWIESGGPSLDLVGTRLDASGSFRQAFSEALSPAGVYPSIVDIPAAGCWLLQLRTGKLAGAIVVRAVDARG
jgi:hypothetical protein